MISPMLTSLQNRMEPTFPNKYSSYNFDPMSSSSQIPDLSGILQPIQQQIGLTQSQGAQTLQDYLNTRNQQRQSLSGDLMNTMNAGLTASIPGIEDRLQNLGLLQSGAYPEAIERQKAGLLASNVLPAMQQFDTSTFDTAAGLPLQTAQQIQGLETGSLGRQFGLQDMASQQAFQGGLADKLAQQQQLQTLIGLIPGLLGSGGIPGLFGSSGGLDGLGGDAGGFGGGGGSGGGAGGWGDLLSGRGGWRGALGGAGGGAFGSAIGEQLGGGTGAGIGGALAALLGGGGLGGALGGGLGGAFGGPLGGAIGGGLGNVAEDFALPYLQDYFGMDNPLFGIGGMFSGG